PSVSRWSQPRALGVSLVQCDMDSTQLKIAPIGEGSSLKVRAYEALKSAIMTMNIYVEEAVLRLDERDLSERLGISRTPLREALAQLSQESPLPRQPM